MVATPLAAALGIAILLACAPHAAAAAEPAQDKERADPPVLMYPASGRPGLEQSPDASGTIEAEPRGGRGKTARPRAAESSTAKPAAKPKTAVPKAATPGASRHPSPKRSVPRRKDAKEMKNKVSTPQPGAQPEVTYPDTFTPLPAAGMTADEAWGRLMDGNRRYVSASFIHPEHLSERRKRVAMRQMPFAVVLGCVDSRVPPELVFDQGLGDLVVVRVAGHVPGPYVLGSIEFAVESFGTPLVVVLGHERCAMVEAAVRVSGGGSRPMVGYTAKLVEPILPAVEKAKAQRPTSHEALLDQSIRIHVQQVTETLQGMSPLLNHHAKEGKLRIIGARYDLDTGTVDLVP